MVAAYDPRYGAQGTALLERGRRVVTAPRIIRVGDVNDLGQLFQHNRIRTNRPVLVCVGGADGLAGNAISAITGLLVQYLCPALDRWDAVVVDGGTDSGVMRLMGRARRQSGAQFPLVGVAAGGKVKVGNAGAAATAEPESNHTHLVLVPGREWGDETPWIVDSATAIACGSRSVTMLVNGGKVSLADCAASIAAHRPIIALRGSGRAADEIAAARDGLRSDPEAAKVAASPLTVIVPLHRPLLVVEALEEALLPPR